MGAIIRAIISACKNAFRIGAALLSAPFRMFVGGHGEPPEIEMPEPFEESPPRQDMTAMYDAIARAIINWAADSIIESAPAPVPPQVPRELRAWLPGLSRDECCMIIDADRMAVSAHIQSLFTLPGVRPVQPLRAVVWPPEAPYRESPGFAAIAALELLELERS